MTDLLDTSTCVAALRGSTVVIERLSRAGPGDLVLSIMTVAELRHGVLLSRDPGRTGLEVRAFLAPFAVLPFDAAEAESHAVIRVALQARGTPIGERDLIIAATALANGLSVVTANTREFRRVPGLAVEDWSV